MPRFRQNNAKNTDFGKYKKTIKTIKSYFEKPEPTNHIGISLQITSFKNCKSPHLIYKYNEENPKSKMELPTIRAVITDEKYGYVDECGVFIIPIGALRE